MPAKFRVSITPLAEKDIEEIWSFIAADSPDRALEFVVELERQVSRLERFPLRCPLIPENDVLGAQYRHLIFGNYRTLFRVTEDSVNVLRVVHGARLLDSSLFEAPDI